MRVSRFVFFYDDLGFLWHSLHSRRLFLSEKARATVRGLANADYSKNELIGLLGEDYQALRVSGILTSAGEDDKSVEELKRLSVSQQIQGLYLIVTTSCNLDCSYCLYGASASGSLSGKARTMEPDIATKAVRLFGSLASDNNRSGDYWEQITLYGGEPLLNPPAIAAAVKQVRREQAAGRLSQIARIVINTNGTLASRPIVKMLVKEGVEFQVSIDGFQTVHDANRKTKFGEGSFTETIRGLKALSQMGATIVPMITVSEANLDKLPVFVPWLVHEFNVREYNMNVMMSGTGDTSSNYPERAAQKMLEAAKNGESAGAVDFGLSGLLGGFQSGTICSPACGTSRKITVFPDGNLHVCQALEESGLSGIGSLSEGIKPDSRLRWLSRSRFDVPECLVCPAIAACGGGCAAGSFHTTGRTDGIDPNSCRWTRKVFDTWIASPP